MRRRILVVVSAVLSAASFNAARAADLPRKAQPYQSPVVNNWTGWYVGLNAGAVMSSGKFSVVPNQVGFPGGGAFSAAAAASFVETLDRTERDAGFTGGGQFGYAYQFKNVVIGFEIDFGYTGVNKTFSGTTSNGSAVTESYRSDWLNTDRVRLGYVSGPAVYYVTGGLAVANVEVATTAVGGPGRIVGSDTTTKLGWTAGAGAEWMVAPRWSVKFEYLHVDLGTAELRSTDGNFPLGFIDTSLRLREDIVRFGVNYRL